MTNQDLASLLKEVRKSAAKAAAFQLTELNRFNASDIVYKGKNDLVSYVDKQTEDLLVDDLSRLLPEASILAEEGGMKENKSLQWIIDPLDGTTNYLHRLPVFSISIALRENGKEIAGLVHEANKNECFYAWENGGAFCNDEKITVSKTNTLSGSLIATGFPYSLLDKTDSYFEIMKELLLKSHGLRRFGSAAVDLCYTACGRFEGYFEFNLKDWDVAAGALIVKEAGGRVSDFKGGNNFHSGHEVLATGNIHEEMLQVIQKYW
ncbi:MAG TPA: inositol monophosphatase family protein [Cytophagaceae bacterium]|jgi:myo-inositol-1(or 4)-monophosphatase|nr:inositol monophosphatase family protein [Cytophagaceae bacterium]